MWCNTKEKHVATVNLYMNRINAKTTYIKTNGSESRGQERAKRITKNKMRDELLYVFYTSKSFCNMTS